MSSCQNEHKLKLTEKISAGLTALYSGKILIVNTDTVPGLAVLPFHSRAVDKLYQLKGRDVKKPLVWMVHDFSIIKSELIVEPYVYPLMERYWPGAITLVFSVRPESKINQQIETNSLAVRIPKGDNMLLTFLKELNAPLAVTSVNRSGNKELIQELDIRKEFADTLYYGLFSDNNLQNGKNTESFNKKVFTNTTKTTKIIKTSTVVDVRTHKFNVLRKGAIKLD